MNFWLQQKGADEMGNIIDGDAQERAIGDALGDKMAEQALAGMYAGGRNIRATARTQHEGRDVFSLSFDDGTVMRISSETGLRIEVVSGGRATVSTDDSDVIEGEAVDADEVAQGNQLMTGDDARP